MHPKLAEISRYAVTLSEQAKTALLQMKIPKPQGSLAGSSMFDNSSGAPGDSELKLNVLLSRIANE